MGEPERPAPQNPESLGFQSIVYEKDPPRATITLNRPDVLNAFDFRMLRELARACEDASWDDSIRVVVLTGAGRAFCVGADLKSWSGDYLGKPGEYWKWFGAFKDAHDRLREIVLLCEEIPAGKAEDWGLVNRAVPAAELDSEVDRFVESLARKLPQTTRYARQHLNFWRDFAWHQTVNHARDWLALSMATEEPQEAIKKFLEKK